jgi:hypothetical protein
LLLCLWSHWSHQDGSALSLQLDKYPRDILVAGERENYSAADEVKVRVEGVGVIQLDANRHIELEDGELLIVIV